MIYNLFAKFEVIDICTELLLLIRIYKMQKQVPKVALCRLFHHPLIFGIRKSKGKLAARAEKTQPFGEPGIAGIISKSVTSDDEA